MLEKRFKERIIIKLQNLLNKKYSEDIVRFVTNLLKYFNIDLTNEENKYIFSMYLEDLHKYDLDFLHKRFEHIRKNWRPYRYSQRYPAIEEIVQGYQYWIDAKKQGRKLLTAPDIRIKTNAEKEFKFFVCFYSKKMLEKYSNEDQKIITNYLKNANNSRHITNDDELVSYLHEKKNRRIYEEI